MTDILSKDGRRTLEKFCAGRVVLVFDYDGTLAPLVDRPDSARMRPGTRRLLASVAQTYPSAVLTGRARADVLPFIRGIGVAHVVGNHGIEWDPPDASEAGIVRKVGDWRGTLSGMLEGVQGVWIEDKRLSLSVHYRRARKKAVASRAVHNAVRWLHGARLVEGKHVLNILPAGKGGKWEALEKMMRTTRCPRAIFAGDDMTDEEVFERADPRRVLTIRVGCRTRTHAGFCLRSQREIDRLLGLLRAAPSGVASVRVGS